LRQRGVRSPELQVLEEAVRGWLAARDTADRGEFATALEGADRSLRLLGGGLGILERFRGDLLRRQQTCAGLLPRLHEAADNGRWREALEATEQVLAAAPHHPDARKVRARAWQAVEPVTVALGPPSPEAIEVNGTGCDGLPARFLLWVDGVGGYLVCLGSRLTFGQATLDAHADVPLVADVSRLHATLTRDAEGYVLEAVRPVQVNGEPLTRALLQSGDRVTLGTSCQFQFRLPVPASNTARLDLVSGHRLPVAVDGILLMADTLVLGGGVQAHVTVPDLKDPVVLYRHKDGLGLRHDGSLRVNGQPTPARGLLPAQAVVTGEEVSFAVEPVGARLG